MGKKPDVTHILSPLKSVQSYTAYTQQNRDCAICRIEHNHVFWLHSIKMSLNHMS
jgi:hypothetical protein